MKEHVFNKQKMVSMMKLSKDILVNFKLESGSDYGDYVQNTLTYRLEAEFYQMSIAQKEITYHFDRPTFLDWLFRRTKTKTIKINIDDALLNPPKTDNTVRLYNLEQLD